MRDWCKARRADGSPGELWRPDEVIPVRIKRLEVASDWYAQAVTYRRVRRGGTHALLTLVPPDSFAAEPEKGSSDPFAGTFGTPSTGPVEPDFPEAGDE